MCITTYLARAYVRVVLLRRYRLAKANFMCGKRLEACSALERAVDLTQRDESAAAASGERAPTEDT